jgi:hypothetical protein
MAMYFTVLPNEDSYRYIADSAYRDSVDPIRSYKCGVAGLQGVRAPPRTFISSQVLHGSCQSAERQIPNRSGQACRTCLGSAGKVKVIRKIEALPHRLE